MNWGLLIFYIVINLSVMLGCLIGDCGYCSLFRKYDYDYGVDWYDYRPLNLLGRILIAIIITAFPLITIIRLLGRLIGLKFQDL